jgi:PAS domain S-box-containing protein
VQGFFAASERVSRKEFRTYFNSLLLERNYPGMQGIGFSQLVRSGELQRHVRAVRAETGMDYTVRPEGTRPFYTPIVYLEPFMGRNLRAFGYDMYSEPIRHAAMARSADSASMAITGKLTLVQETSENMQTGFLMFRPLYQSMELNPPPAERRKALRGWVYAAFRINNLMSGLFGERSSDTELEIYDGRSPSASTLMYASQKDAGVRTAARFSQQQTIDIAGHAWTAVVRSAPGFENAFDTKKPIITAVAGVGIGIMFTLLAMLLVNSRSRALKALSVEGQYRNLMHQANDGILVVDMKRRITDANEQACTHFGYSLDELRTMCLEQLHPPESAAAVIAQFESLKSNESARFEVISRRKDGSLVPDEISERIVNVGDGEYVLKFVRDISERKRAEHEREKLVSELQAALADVKTLSGLIPICSSCKKIRDDTGYWNVLEQYLVEHSEAQFTHGICPDCMKKLYPDYVKMMNKT